ncbi:MAG: UTRA domain-containing protein [Luteitalea sp.]|nr:UTRA domain-containing protein [Luteitalea sp.]
MRRPLLAKSAKLDATSPLPLYAQVEQLLRDLIRDRPYQKGRLLPDEITLAREWGVSRNTVRTAMGTLVAEGVLQRQSGVGTRVRRDRFASGVAAWQSFSKEMARRGVTVERFSTRCIEVTASADVAEALEVAPGTPVLLLDRVRGWDGTPSVDFQSYLHPRLGLTTDEDYERPLYELIAERSGIVAQRSVDEFTAIAADKGLARRLGVRIGTPLLWRKRIVCDRAGKPVELACVTYRSDRFTLTLTLE